MNYKWALFTLNFSACILCLISTISSSHEGLSLSNLFLFLFNGFLAFINGKDALELTRDKIYDISKYKLDNYVCDNFKCGFIEDFSLEDSRNIYLILKNGFKVSDKKIKKYISKENFNIIKKELKNEKKKFKTR
jgi:hypothetical protein